MTAAIFGLLGVVAGAVLSGLIQWRMERAKAAIQSRAAFRLLAADFYVAQALIKPVLDTGAWGPERIDLPLEAFAESRAEIAARLDLADWKKVEGAVLGIRRLNDIRQTAQEANRSFEPAELNDFRRIGQWIDETIVCVQRYVR